MSRTIHTYPLRTLAVAGFLGVASLVAPAVTHAQTIGPERALLNTTPVLSYRAVTVASGPSQVDGEWALLGRSTVGVASRPNTAIGSLGVSRPVDGERALLNTVALFESRRLTLAF